MNRKWVVIARHKWLAGCTITELDDDSNDGPLAYRRFVATIRGFRNWKIYEGFCYEGLANEIGGCVEAIRDRIDKGEEKVFYEKGFFIPRKEVK